MNTFINRKKWPKKLLVEGNDDLHVIANIRNGHLMTDNFEIVDCQGVTEIPDKLLAFIKNKVEVIGVVVDADDNLSARWQSIRNTLISQGYNVPIKPERNGTIIRGLERQPKIGIWIMPDNVQQPGMLEHFVTTLIPAEDKLKPVAEEVLNRLETESINGYKLIHRSKALIHTWLAWQEAPGTPMGLAITKSYLDHNTELCDRCATWLKELFG